MNFRASLFLCILTIEEITMPVNRAILADITDLKLDPTKAHKLDKDGRLQKAFIAAPKKHKKFVEPVVVVPIVETKVVVPVVEPVLEVVVEAPPPVEVASDVKQPKAKKSKKDDEGSEPSSAV